MKSITPLPLKPKEYTVHQILTLILNNTFPPESVLPGERELAKQLGVTRQTLREVLQRLASEGWVTISHGKPTVVNHYWQEGGHGILSSIAGYAEYLPRDFVRDLTEFRIFTTPAMTKKAADRRPEILLAHLNTAGELADTADAFVKFDWRLQWLAARYSGNKIFPLMLNDYMGIFHRLGRQYFSYAYSRQASMQYYRDLTDAIRSQSGNIGEIVEAVMRNSLEIWLKIQGDADHDVEHLLD